MRLRPRMFYFEKDYKEKGEKMPFGVKIVNKTAEKDITELVNLDKIYFSVNYPGLLIGTGTSIECAPLDKEKKDEEKTDKEKVSKKKVDNEFKTGLSFDYTTGIPYIPGSSIKGILRDFFPKRYKEEDEKIEEKKIEKEKLEEEKIEKEKIEEENNTKTELINQILGKTYTSDDLYNIMLAIFEGRKSSKKEKEYLPIYKRDKFIEGRIIVEGNEKIELLYKDYITPHKKILENPVPIRILKILPETKIELLFQLYDTEIDGINMTKEEKLKLFKEIFYLTGIGAKTNVGYGHFDQEKSEELETKREKEEERRKIEILKMNMTPFERFKYQFENECSEEEKKGKYSEIENFEGEEKKEVARLMLEVFEKEKKPSKKTNNKIKELKKILESE